MIAYYDMNTGEWAGGDDAEPTILTDARYAPPTPVSQLMHVHETVDAMPRKQELPDDIATLPVSVILAKWS